MMRRRHAPDQRGLTLVELVVFIVVVSAGLAGVLSVIDVSAKASADPLLRKQAQAVAEAMLDEILSKAYQNDRDDPVHTSSTLGCTANTTPACRSNTPKDRARYNDVDDYIGWKQDAVQDLFGDAVAGLEHCQVSVAVSALTLADAASNNGVAGKQVTVTVAMGKESVAFSGFRANF